MNDTLLITIIILSAITAVLSFAAIIIALKNKSSDNSAEIISKITEMCKIWG